MDFRECFAVCGQTYPRKLDFQVLTVLSGVAQSAHKFANDIRLLQHLKQIEEPFEQSQVGSSAMPYKRNPMRCERITALSRFVIVDSLNPAITAACQWFERTLDDSANRRLATPEAFLATDGILSVYLNVIQGIVVYPKMIEQHFMKEIPFMATENILLKCVKKGGDRQDLHERIRQHANAAGRRVKSEGLENNLCELIAGDPVFGVTLEELRAVLEPRNYVGRAPEQVTEFVEECVVPILEQSAEDLGLSVKLEV
jgi:adenylosuccinate lyase